MKEITIRKAHMSDAETVYQIMVDAQKHIWDKNAYSIGDMEYVVYHIRDNGFTLVAEDGENIVGFLMVDIPGLGEDNLGYDLDFTEQQLMDTAIMESAAVLPEYQGRGIMGAMFKQAVEMTEREYTYLLGTVHPDNTPSRRNFEKLGFHCLLIKEKYGGKLRCVMGRFRETP